MSDRFYCPDPPVEDRLTLDEGEARHLGKVLRLGIGDRVEVFDGRGSAWAAEVRTVGRDRVVLEVVGAPLPDRAAPCRLTLATAVPKGERFDWLVEKATELGVARLIPLVTERSVVDPRPTRIDRLRRAIVEASKQCGRNTLMELDRPHRWEELVRQPLGAHRWLAHPGEVPASGWPRPRQGESAALAVGPEGGFTDAEVEAARGSGWQVIALGATLLRIETACVAGCAALLALCEGSVE